MGFGSSAKKPKTQGQSTNTSTTHFMNIKRGIRTFRILPNTDEIRIKQHWLALEGSGQWVPSFGYNRADKRDKRPITVAVFDPFDGEYGTWNGDSDNWYNNPINKWVDDADVDDETREKMYAKELFYLNVLNRTLVKTDGDVIHYPDPSNKYPSGTDSIVPKSLNRVEVMQGSSGKVRDPKTGDLVGKHLYAGLVGTIEGDEIDPVSGQRLTPDMYDIRLKTTGIDKETERNFSITANRDVINWNTYKAYDLKSWVKPWPDAAIQDLLDGAKYLEVVKTYNIMLFPEQVPIFPASESAFDDGEEVPF